MANDDKPTSLKKISGLAKVISITLLVGIANDSLLALSQVFALIIGPAGADANTWTPMQTAQIFIEAGLGLMSLVIYIVNVVVILQWMFRGFLNLQFVDAPLRHKPVWAIFYWFVPFVNLVKPYQLMKELWTLSGKSGTDSSGNVIYDKPPGLFPLWWTCWLTCNFLGTFVFRMANAAGMEGLVEGLSLLSNLLSIVAALVLRTLILQITARQQEKIPELASL